jgi:AraC-like DNA-binding protein
VANLVRSASLTNYVEVARAAGLDPMTFLADAGLSPACLDDPDMRISSDAARGLLEAAATASGLDNFGLRMAESRRLSNLGVVTLVAREEPTVRRAMQALMRYTTQLNEALFIHFEESDGLAVIREELLVGKPGPCRQAIELAVGVYFRCLAHFLGPAWNPVRVCFAHAPPRDLSVHHRVFGYAVEFGQDFNGMVCTTRDLDVLNPAADPVLARYARQIVDVATVAGRMSAADEVRHALFMLLPTGQCSLEAVAQRIGVDRRTVHRRLERDGTAFSAVLNTMRRELASHYVDDGRRPLTQVAELLGFSTLSVFSRWYKQQFGDVAHRRRGAGIDAGVAQAVDRTRSR